MQVSLKDISFMILLILGGDSYLKKRYIFLGIIVFISAFRAVLGNWWTLIYLLPLIWTPYLISEIEKSKSNSKGLTQNQKIQVIITEIFNPLIAGAFYYYCWKKEFPKKASQANIYSWVIVGIEIIGIPILGQLGINIFKL